MARIGLTQLPRKVAEYTGQDAPSYRRCFDYAVADRFPAEYANSRWTVDEADIAKIAAAFGMKAALPPAKSRRTAATQVAA